MKKFLSVLLAVIMALSIVPMAGVISFAETSGDFEYSVISEENKTCKIKKYIGSATELTVPSEIDGYTVTEFYYGAFEGYTSLTSITIPDSLTDIGLGAFSGCSSLTSFNAGADNKYFSSSDGVLFNKDKTELLLYPTGNTRASYVIPDGVTKIGYGAFSDCVSIESVTLPGSVKNIHHFAFYKCTSLKSVAFPDGLEIIGNSAFYGCTSLESVNFSETLVVIDGSAFRNCCSLTNVTIPDSVNKICESAFEGCTLIKGVTIPESVKEIYDYAFGYYTDEADSTHKKTDGFTVHGYTGSAAERYADNNGFNFISYTEYDKAVEQANAIERSHYIAESLVALDNALAVDVSAISVTEQSVVDEQTKAIIDAINGLKMKSVSMYRLYNPNSGEHFYTADVNEKDWLISLGWTFEGIGWAAPVASSAPVYRLYNKEGGEHHYTTDENEKDQLVFLGWTDEGIGWYSDDAQGVTVYRQYNPNAIANNHNFTANKAENDWLVGLGWRAEGIAWYGVA